MQDLFVKIITIFDTEQAGERFGYFQIDDIYYCYGYILQLTCSKVSGAIQGGEEAMFGIGLPELGLILIIALVVFGPKKLPEIGRAMGKSLNEFRRATDEIKKDIHGKSDQEREK